MRLFWIALAPLVAAAAAAQDAPAPDPVAAAKKDLAEMKAPSGQQDAASALPSLDLKDMGPLPGADHADAAAAVPDKDPSLDPAKRKSGTGNWLVDAMDKRTDRQRDSRTRGSDDGSKSDLDLLLGDKSGEGYDKDASGEEGTAAGRDDARDPDAGASKAYNPLDSFMGSWVSANDRELLAPSRADPSRSDLIAGLDGAPQVSAPDAAPGEAEDWAPIADAAPNPYVGALGDTLEPQVRIPAPAGPDDFETLFMPDVSKGLSAPAAGPEPSADQRSVVPDFAQPTDDDKYFRQLKRF
ncbi:MAG TPA: hypothetical protein VGG34_02040 [Opitutaceae bacterium]|jgi:hypothetical protein